MLVFGGEPAGLLDALHRHLYWHVLSIYCERSLALKAGLPTSSRPEGKR
jgi:hypothetical protein